MGNFLKKKEIKKNVIEICLNRPELHNAFNDELIQQLTDEFKVLSQNEDLRLIVLTGEGKSFCAGADLNWMKSMKDYSEAENKADSIKLFELFEAIDNCPVPVLGKINGHALGGGLGLVAVCDFAMTTDRAKFGFTEVKLGLIPAVISAFCLKKIGFGQARSWFLSGEKFNGDVAMDMNLIHEVTCVEDFEENFNEVLDKFLTAGPQAARSAKELIKNLEKLDPSEVKEFTCSAIAKLRVGAEGQEGMSSLLEKRTANWIEE